MIVRLWARDPLDSSGLLCTNWAPDPLGPLVPGTHWSNLDPGGPFRSEPIVLGPFGFVTL
jgi:hypothetical protein